MTQDAPKQWPYTKSAIDRLMPKAVGEAFFLVLFSPLAALTIKRRFARPFRGLKLLFVMYWLCNLAGVTWQVIAMVRLRRRTSAPMLAVATAVIVLPRQYRQWLAKQTPGPIDANHFQIWVQSQLLAGEIAKKLRANPAFRDLETRIKDLMPE